MKFGPQNPEDPAVILKDAIKRFSAAFGNDLELVRVKANEHHVGLTRGGILLPPQAGKYNLRIPTGSRQEVSALLTAGQVLVGCMDYRQSAEIYDATTPNAVIEMAGGAAQPDHGRRGALVDFLFTVSQLNRNVHFLLLGHNRVCGGIDHATQGAIARTFQEGGYSAERTELVEYLRQTASNLESHGVPYVRYSLGIARIGEGNDYLGLDNDI